MNLKKQKEETISIIATEQNNYNILKIHSDALEAKYTKLQVENNSLNESKIQIEKEVSIKIQENKNHHEHILAYFKLS